MANKFSFKWKVMDLDKVPSNSLNMAKYLLEHDLVSVNRKLVDREVNGEMTKFIEIFTPPCMKILFVDALHEYMTSSYEDRYAILRSHVEEDYISREECVHCNNTSCDTCDLSRCCPLIVAGYLYYLKNSGSGDIDVKSKKMTYNSKAQAEYEKFCKKNESEFDDFENIKKIVYEHMGEGVDSLRMSISGTKGTGKLALFREINEYMFNIGKVPRINSHTIEWGNIKSKESIGKNIMTYIKIPDDIDVNDTVYEASHSVSEVLSAENSLSTSEIVDVLASLGSEYYIVLSGHPATMRKLFSSYVKLQFSFRKSVNLPNWNSSRVLKETKRNIDEKENKSLSGFFNKHEDEIYQFVLENHMYIPFKNIELSNFLSTYIINNNKTTSKTINLPDVPQKGINVEKEFESIIGMREVKDQVSRLETFLKFRRRANDENIVALPDFHMHMMFLGSPGTGKTMVARLITKMLYDMGYIENNKLVEVDRKDLVAEYVGHTALKVEKLIRGAMGGVLFIDEAYSLVQGDKDQFGAEAVATLTKAMEDYRGDIVIIFAGYEKETQQFIEFNSGLSSRIGYTFRFKDYETEELLSIFKLKLNKIGLLISNDALTSVKKIISFYATSQNFGNGRFIDKLIQEIMLKHANIAGDNCSVERYRTIEVDDVVTDEEVIKTTVVNKDLVRLPSEICDEDKRLVTYHELGHAFVSYALNRKRKIKEIRLMPTADGALGYVLYEPDRAGISTSIDMYCEIMCVLAGKAVERVVMNTVTSGPSSDIKHAHKIARQMVVDYGMYNGILGGSDESDKKAIGEAIQSIVNIAYTDTEKFIKENIDVLPKIFIELSKKEVTSGEEFAKIIDKIGYKTIDEAIIANDKFGFNASQIASLLM